MLLMAKEFILHKVITCRINTYKARGAIAPKHDAKIKIGQ